MSEVKLFRISSGAAVELPGARTRHERSIQGLVEANLESLLGVRFLASEYTNGGRHSGRIATLGIDRDNCPVVIQYEHASNGHVINQGLFYLDWLLEHRAEFMLLCMKVLGPHIQGQIDWNGRRLICIATDFSRYDEHAVGQIDRNIELVRYRHYGDDLMVLELVAASGGPPRESSPPAPAVGAPRGAKPLSPDATVCEQLERSPDELRTLYRAFEGFSLALGKDVTRKALKYYFVFRRAMNFACLEVHAREHKLVAYVKANPDEVELVPGFTRNVRRVDHLGTGDLEITLTNLEDLKRARPLITASYMASDGSLR